MYSSMLKAKIHQARVTGSDLNYVGSITIDEDILDAAGILPYEKVLVVDIENGNRFETYVIVGARDTGEIQLNGAAARLVQVGDRVIIMAFALVENPTKDWTPKVLILDETNAIIPAVE